MAETSISIRQSRYDPGTRLQALCLLENKISVAIIKDITGIATSQIYGIRKTAYSRGYNPKVNKKLFFAYVKDAQRSKQSPKAIEEIKQQVV